MYVFNVYFSYWKNIIKDLRKRQINKIIITKQADQFLLHFFSVCNFLFCVEFNINIQARCCCRLFRITLFYFAFYFFLFFFILHTQCYIYFPSFAENRIDNFPPISRDITYICFIFFFHFPPLYVYDIFHILFYIYSSFLSITAEKAFYYCYSLHCCFWLLP